MISKLDSETIKRRYIYREIPYSITTNHQPVIGDYFCAYFFLTLRRFNLELDLKAEKHNEKSRRPNFLKSKLILEIESCCHGGISFGEWTCEAGKDFIKDGYIKIGVDYAHYGDHDGFNNLEGVCEDCEKVIDKIHDMGIFKGD